MNRMDLTAQDKVLRQATSEDFIKLLWSKVVFLSSGCWIIPSISKSHNPRVWLKGRRVGAHRLALYAASKFIPKQKFCLHRCGNGVCVRPSHLYWGNQQQNMADRIFHYKQKNKDINLCKNLMGIYDDETVRWMWLSYFYDGLSMSAIVYETGASHSYVSQILRRKRRKKVTEKYIGNYQIEQALRMSDRSNWSSGRWINNKMNNKRLSDHLVRDIRNKINNGARIKDLVTEYSLTFAIVSQVASNRTYKWVQPWVKRYRWQNRARGSLSHRTKLTDGDVRKIWAMHHYNHDATKKIATAFNVTPKVVRCILRGETWRHVTGKL